MKSYTTPRKLLAEIDRLLSARPDRRNSPLEAVLEALYDGRHYFWIGLYLDAGERLERQAFCGPQPHDDRSCRSFALNQGNVGTTAARGVTKIVPDVTKDPDYRKCFAEVRSALVAPINIGVHVLGVINVESDRPNAFGGEDRVLIEAVAERVAKYLETGGRYLLRRLREGMQLQNVHSAGA